MRPGRFFVACALSLSIAGCFEERFLAEVATRCDERSVVLSTAGNSELGTLGASEGFRVLTYEESTGLFFVELGEDGGVRRGPFSLGRKDRVRGAQLIRERDGYRAVFLRVEDGVRSLRSSFIDPEAQGAVSDETNVVTSPSRGFRLALGEGPPTVVWIDELERELAVSTLTEGVAEPAIARIEWDLSWRLGDVVQDSRGDVFVLWNDDGARSVLRFSGAESSRVVDGAVGEEAKLVNDDGSVWLARSDEAQLELLPLSENGAARTVPLTGSIRHLSTDPSGLSGRLLGWSTGSEVQVALDESVVAVLPDVGTVGDLEIGRTLSRGILLGIEAELNESDRVELIQLCLDP